MAIRVGYTVSASGAMKVSGVELSEAARGVRVGLTRITDEPTLQPSEARELARCLYTLAARVEKRLDQQSNTSNPETPTLSEGRHEAREESETSSPPDFRPHGEYLRKAAG